MHTSSNAFCVVRIVFVLSLLSVVCFVCRHFFCLSSECFFSLLLWICTLIIDLSFFSFFYSHVQPPPRPLPPPTPFFSFPLFLLPLPTRFPTSLPLSPPLLCLCPPLPPVIVMGVLLQLALLQYRLNMSSMPCQPPALPGPGSHHTYQVF